LAEGIVRTAEVNDTPRRSSTHDLAGTVVADRYRLERELGRGGMATVWLARDLRHERPVAIKIIHPELAGAIGVDRFVREVRLTARLQHPNIVPILDSGALPTADARSLPWYAMTYLEGETLRGRLAREHQLPIGEALRITEAVGTALAAAHRQGIVHRDVKPENVFLSGPHVYVVDFGIAKALADTDLERLTSTGLALGTPVYMSPEQATGGGVDARGDQYSLATMLYEMLAGEPPFTGPTAQAIVARRLSEPARPILPVRSTVPVPVERAVLRALERVPADRFPDLDGFLAALRGNAPPAPARPRRPGARAIGYAAGLAALIAGGWLLASRRPPVAAARAQDPEIQALYQRGVRAYDRRTPGAIAEAITVFGRALERDSAYTPAWTGLAKAYVRAYERAFAVAGLPRDSIRQRAIVAADRALASDSTSADAWLTRAMVSRTVDPTDVGPALRSVRRAIEVDSTSVPAWHALATDLAEAGDLEAATAAWRRCARLAPSNTQTLAFLGIVYTWRRQYDSAAVWADSALALDPNYLLARTGAGALAVERGDFVRAAAHFDAAKRLSTGVEVVNALAGRALVEARAGRGPAARAFLRAADSLAAPYLPTPLHTAVYLAQAHAAVGQADRAITWLVRYETSLDLHFQLHLRCDPPLDPIRNDQRFQALLARPAPPAGQGCR
jgi:serine/threonine protein kinase